MHEGLFQFYGFYLFKSRGLNFECSFVIVEFRDIISGHPNKKFNNFLKIVTMFYFIFWNEMLF